jgi:hypothetical protein
MYTCSRAHTCASQQRRRRQQQQQQRGGGNSGSVSRGVRHKPRKRAAHSSYSTKYVVALTLYFVSMGGSPAHMTEEVTPTSAQLVMMATMVITSSTLSQTPMPLLV